MMSLSEFKKLYADQCQKGNHDWQDLMTAGVDSVGGAYVARWCSICGCVTGDFEVDGRLVGKGTLFPLEAPSLYKYLPLLHENDLLE